LEYEAIKIRREGHTCYRDAIDLRNSSSCRRKLFLRSAKRPIKGYYTQESERCIFGGNLQRVWPTHEVMSLASGVTVSTIVPHKIGPVALTLPAGLYALYVATLTVCDWHFSLESTSQNTAGLTPCGDARERQRAGIVVEQQGTLESSSTASMKDQVQFYAQYRTDHGSNVRASGDLQIIHEGKIVRTFLLKVGHDVASGANDFTWTSSGKRTTADIWVRTL
jgi:hypothetical protein